MATPRAWMKALGACAVITGVVLLPAPAQARHIDGTPGRDILVGTQRGDRIHARGGDDAIRALGGRDVARGGEGDDHIFLGPGILTRIGEIGEFGYGGPGDDRVYGQTGDDSLAGGGGNDGIYGGPGSDILFGGSGDDLLKGGRAYDILDAGTGKDVIRAGPGDDEVSDGVGQDRFHLGPGRDLIYGLTDDGLPDLINCGLGHDLVAVFAPRLDPLDRYVGCEEFDFG